MNVLKTHGRITRKYCAFVVRMRWENVWEKIVLYSPQIGSGKNQTNKDSTVFEPTYYII